MSWIDAHRRAEECSALAILYLQQNDREAALREFRKAARHEEIAFAELDPKKVRTRGIIGVSAASLWYKGGNLSASEEMSLKILQDNNISAPFIEQSRIILQTIWIEYAKKSSESRFAPGQILISLKGGQILVGGAPLDLILERFEYIKGMFIRSVEYLKGVKFRRRGPPSKDIQSAFRPWIFQTAPGSYQFSVAIERPEQPDFFVTGYDPDSIAEFFLDIIRASTAADSSALNELIKDDDYKTGFLRMTRNLAPTGHNFDEMEMRSLNSEKTARLTRADRTAVSENLKSSLISPSPVPTEFTSHDFTGTLRAVHLNEDWLELSIEDKMFRIEDLRDNVDDIIGPMLNKLVSVKTLFNGKRFTLIDIERIE